MAIARVDQGSGVYWLSAVQLASGPVYVERALTVNVTAGSTLVAVHLCGANDPATFSGGGATWVAPASASIWHSALAQYVQIGYGYNAAGGATTVRATGSLNTQNRQILVMELTGMLTTDPVTGTPTEAQASASSVPLPGSITSDGDAIFIGAAQFHPTGEPTAASGYTNRYYEAAGAGFYSRAIVDQIITGAATSNPGWSSNKDYFVAVGIALKAASGGGSQALEGAATGGAAASGELAGTKPLEGAATGGATASGDLGRQFRFTLYAVDGSTPLANKTGLWWAWWDVLADVRSTAPDASGTGATTDASGVFSVVAPTALSAGDNQGFGIISDQDATPDATEAAYVGSFDVV